MNSVLTAIGEVDETALSRPYDVVLLACGYESRSRSFIDDFVENRGSRFALLFPGQQTLAFEENYAAFVSSGFAPVELDDDHVAEWFIAALRAAVKPHMQGLDVFVDISSLSRTRLAAIVEAIATADIAANVRVVFAYRLAEYDPPSAVVAPNVAIGPVSSFFAGWRVNSEHPTALVVGLGYEADRALGAVEHLDPPYVWTLLPSSPIDDYGAALLAANALLLERVKADRQLVYSVMDPNLTFALLGSIVQHISSYANVLLLPSGPKILVLMCLLLATSRLDVAVWRVGASVPDEPVDRRPSDKKVLFECVVARGTD